MAVSARVALAVLLSALLFAVAGPASGADLQWSPLAPLPAAGPVFSLANDPASPGTAYAATMGSGLLRTDDGKSWRAAELAPALGAFSWVLWTALWQPTAPGEYTLKVRARDGGGVPQTSQAARTLPDGASGYHAIRVRVRP